MKRVVYVTMGLLGAALVVAVLFSSTSMPRGGIEENKLRIVSLAPSVTEMLFALGVEDCIVGVTDRCDYPPQAKDLDRIGGFGTPNVEKLLALSPDLVIATGIERADATVILRRSGIRVLWVKTGNFPELFETLLEIGRQVERPQRAVELVATMQAELETIAEQHRHIPVDRRPRVFVEIWNDPVTTAGGGSFVDELITRAGGLNVAHELDAAYPAVNPEKVVEWDPNVIVLCYMNAEQPILAQEALAGRIGWNDIAAVRSGSVISDITPDLLLRPGPRLIEGAKALSRRLHGVATEETVPR
ncbi:MAG: cobalamin-binding protein [Planctomycetota bacterium]